MTPHTYVRTKQTQFDPLAQKNCHSFFRKAFGLRPLIKGYTEQNVVILNVIINYTINYRSPLTFLDLLFTSEFEHGHDHSILLLPIKNISNARLSYTKDK